MEEKISYDQLFLYDSNALIPEMEVKVECFMDGCSFLKTLTELNPIQVILLEPYL